MGDRVRVFEIAEVMRHARGVLESDPLLSDLWVQGEISKVYQSGAGHLYFTLRDASSQLECVMFRNAVRHLGSRLQAGQEVIAHGAVSLYEARGQFQLYADLVEPEGLGQAFLAFELLRRRLEDEGLFAPERKRDLPPFPRRIGVATSPGGAVIHDIARVLARRYPLAEVVLAGCSVQGEAAPQEIVAALRRLNDYAAAHLTDDSQGQAIDVIIVARGGGAPEELAVFNDERVVRAIFASTIPVVSAIGHETDVTLADYVADLRAPTPSVAAELVAPDCEALRERVVEWRRRMALAAIAEIQEQRHRVDGARQRLLWHSPKSRIADRRQSVDERARRARRAVRRLLTERAARLAARRLQLETLSPETTLGRGYALCCDARSGALVTVADQIQPGDVVDVRLQRGMLRSTVVTTARIASAVESNPYPEPEVPDGWRNHAV